jgi:hypothetical protein
MYQATTGMGMVSKETESEERMGEGMAKERVANEESMREETKGRTPQGDD